MRSPSTLIHGKDVLHFFRKQGWLIALVFALVTGTAVFYTLGQPNLYSSTAKIVITPQFIQQVLPTQMVSYESYFLTRLTFDTEIEILRSRPLAERVARALAAEQNKADDPGWIETRTKQIQGTLNVARVEGTRLIQISAYADDPASAADIANNAAEQYIFLTAETRLDAYRKSHAWLQEQIADLEAKVQLSEQELIDYIKQHGLAPTPQGTLASLAPDGAESSDGEVLGVLRGQLVTAEIERNRLQERYKGKHPRMVAINKEIEIIQTKIAEVKQRRSGALSEARERAIVDKEKAIRYDLLRRSVDTNKQLYDALISKLKETDITADLSQPEIRIIERAEVPGRPIAPNRKRVALVGATSGLFLGLLLALAVEWLNPRIRSLEEFQHHFEIPVLASVPKVGDGEKRTPALLSVDEPHSIASEAFRTLRTNVKFSHVKQEANTLLVTSSLPREGKTTVTCNLATTMALSGRRVVVVDADLRNPGIHREFSLPNEPGLAHVLAGDVSSYKEVVKEGPSKNLSVITAGLVPPNPSELLDSAMLQQFIAQLSADFDQVIFDSPPVLAVADTSLLSSALHNVLLVFNMARLNRFFIQRTLEQLDKSEAHIYGAVLNYVEPDMQTYYYPGYPGYGAGSKAG